MSRFALFCVLFVSLGAPIKGQFDIPDVLIELLQPKGFSVSIPDEEGISLFAFHGNINREVVNREAGTFSVDVRQANQGRWTFRAPGARLKPGDKIHYWINVDYNDGAGVRGYIKDNQVYEVPGSTCQPGATTVNGGKSACRGELIIVDEFDGTTIDTLKWTVEQKIPTYEDVNLELNYYHNVDDTRFVRGGVLFLKPIPAETEGEVRGELDLRNGCTSDDAKQCYHKQRGGFIIPPVKSAKITSKIPFKYGKVEIKAKLPAGDWIVPVVQVESKEKASDGYTPKIYIAFSRGNDHLTGSAGDDIGGRLLYAGPALKSEEPGRSGKLQTLVANNDRPYSSDYHTYTLEWLPGKMSFYVDSNKYGTIDTTNGFSEFERTWNAKDAPFNKECVISLGVAVGGLSDFPDNYRSGDNPKPWSYTTTSYASSFFNARRTWTPTWKGDGAALRVEYVKVWAV